MRDLSHAAWVNSRTS